MSEAIQLAGEPVKPRKDQLDIDCLGIREGRPERGRSDRLLPLVSSYSAEKAPLAALEIKHHRGSGALY